MIDVTVKTLDSQNHRYSVPDDISVKQFKDRIATSVNIPPDKQRLIYCGRVLQDEKNLSEYNVHEKVIHLVMRAPPQPSNRSGDRRGSGSSSSATGAGTHFRHRATTTQGPSSSGVRLQQAKTMLEKATEILNHLEEASAQNSSSPATAPLSTDQASGSGTSNAGAAAAAAEPMEASSSASSSSQPSDRSERQEQQQRQGPTSPAEELEVLYQEMDALNNMDPPMMEGGHLMTSAMGSNPLMGAITNSLQGGLFQAASAAFVSALSSMGPPVVAVTPTTTTTTSQSPTRTSPQSSTTPSTSTPPTSQPTSSGPTTGPSAPSGASAPSGPSAPSAPSAPSQAREGAATSPGNPLSGLRGITVRITNRGSQRSSGIRLEHPRCSVMVEVLDQYREIQRRLQPFLDVYYRSMVEDRAYDGDNDRQLHIDQLVLWRVSAALHYVSHALHAISDIIIDLRRPPPRQLRARPFIIPQPALVQAQINVAPSADGTHHARVIGRGGAAAAAAAAAASASAGSSGSATSGSDAATTSSSTSTTATPNASTNQSRSYVNMSEYLDDDNGVVFMHVGPNGITIDSLSPEGSGNDPSPNPPPELIQNIMSSLTSQLGMRLGTPSSQSPSSTSGSTASSSSPPSTPGVRRATPVHNSQAAGNSGTNTTNATQTRVTPRAQQVHVTPLHMPGMGLTQFDPFLPCQSHHIRPSTTRRRHRATIQTSSAQNNQSNSQESEETAANQSNPSPPQPSEGASTPASSAANYLSVFANLLAEIMSGNNSGHQSEEEHQQEQMFAQLVRGVMSEVSGSIAGQGDASRGPQSQQTSLQEFLEPFSGTGFFAEGERDTIFSHLFTTVSQCLSMSDLIQLFFGDSGRLNQLYEPLQQFVRDKILRGEDPSETNMERAIDEIIADIDPHLMESASSAAVQDGIDYVNTVHNFVRHRLHDIFNLILNHREQNTFGSVLVSLLRHTMGEFVALSLHCFMDGPQGLERLVEGRVQSIMSGMSSSIQAWSVNTSIMQLRSMLSHLTTTDDHIRRYIVSPDEGRRMDEARQNRMSPLSPVPGPLPVANPAQTDPQHQNGQQENFVEVMEVDELGRMEEVRTSASAEGAIANEEAPLTVTVGSQSWHSAVPQEWLPVITRDVERQRRGVPDTNLSDGYLCGVPLKRRKIATQSKPHGTVQQVLQDTLRQSLRNSGVNRNLIESVAGEVSSDLGSSFANHVRCALRDELDNNQDFKPEKFPKSEQKIRKK